MARSSSVSKSSLGATDVFKQFMKIDEEIESVESQIEQISKSESERERRVAASDMRSKIPMKKQSEKKAGGTAVVTNGKSIDEKMKKTGNDKPSTPCGDGILPEPAIGFFSSPSSPHQNIYTIPLLSAPSGRYRRPPPPRTHQMYPSSVDRGLFIPSAHPSFTPMQQPVYMYNMPPTSPNGGLHRTGLHHSYGGGRPYQPRNNNPVTNFGSIT